MQRNDYTLSTVKAFCIIWTSGFADGEGDKNADRATGSCSFSA